jgi:hypothetical protein
MLVCYVAGVAVEKGDELLCNHGQFSMFSLQLGSLSKTIIVT